MKSQKNRDLNLALNLHEKLNVIGVTENAVITKDKNKDSYKPRTLVDQTLELIDPTPNIYTLFVQFNEHFFWNVLLPVEVKWSNRMTSCAGICSYHPRNKQCVITLSLPLLKLRPRKDLVETLLHEMIHGYLFLTNNNRDRDGHGPEFCKHMHRINKEAGTNITIYHSFHDEVKLYQQHWWRCNGPCQSRAPYFGTVRRAMNRAPGPSDFWWKEHQQNCGGQFIKIKEPENFKKQNMKNNKNSKNVSKERPKESSISKWLTKSDSPSQQYKSNDIPTPKSKPVSKLPNTVSGKSSPKHNDYTSKNPFKINNVLINENIRKLGNNTNNVHGWGVGGPSSSPSASKVSSNTHSGKPKFSCTGKLGGSHTGQSNLLDKFVKNNQNSYKKTLPEKADTSNKSLQSTKIEINAKQSSLSNKSVAQSVNCPICNVSICINVINEHIDVCLNNTNEKSDDYKQCNDNSATDNSSVKWANHETTLKRGNELHEFSNKRLKTENSDKSKLTNCPVCHMGFKAEDIYNHLDICLTEQHPASSSHNTDKTIVINSSSDSDSSDNILVDSPNEAINTQSSHRKNDIPHKPHKCLICNTMITSTMSLSEHLEDCIKTVFNDESTSFSENDSDRSEEIHAPDQKYPCPVCMQLFAENTMNDHLDLCLQGK